MKTSEEAIIDVDETEDDGEDELGGEKDLVQGAPEPEGVEQYLDVIDIEAGELINTKDIVTIDLPKFNIETINGVPSIQKSNLLFTMHDNPKVCSNMILAATKGIRNITITTYLDEEKKELSDVWKFTGVKVKGINFGQIVTVLQPEQRVVQCEIEFSKLTINDAEI